MHMQLKWKHNKPGSKHVLPGVDILTCKYLKIDDEYNNMDMIPEPCSYNPYNEVLNQLKAQHDVRDPLLSPLGYPLASIDFMPLPMFDLPPPLLLFYYATLMCTCNDNNDVVLPQPPLLFNNSFPLTLSPKHMTPIPVTLVTTWSPSMYISSDILKDMQHCM